MEFMNEIEKRNFIRTHLHQIENPALDEIYNKMLSLLNESLLEESEEDIKKGNLITHKDLKQEVSKWRKSK